MELNAPISINEDICDYTDITNLNQSLHKQKLMDATKEKARQLEQAGSAESNGAPA